MTDIFPPAVLLMGPPGTGKSDVLITLMECGLELFVLVTEPRGVESLLDSLHRRQNLNPNNKFLTIDRLHWSYVSPTSSKWAGLTVMAKKVSSMGYASLTELKEGIGKEVANQWIKMLNQVSNFHC